MTENKRYRVFKYIDCEKYGVSDDVVEYTLARFDNHFEAEGLCDLLNELAEENEQLKQEYLKLKHRHNLLHDECLDVECERDSLKKDVGLLEEENEQLKSEKQAIIDVLDEMENGNYFWDRDYLIENISNIESILGLEYD